MTSRMIERFAYVMFALLAAGTPVVAQEAERSVEGAVTGAVLGSASGATLALVGSLEVCNRTLLGSRCSAAATAVGGTLGVVAGGVLGSRSESALHDRLGGAALGAAIGGVVGAGMASVVRQYGWPDAVAFAVVGGAIGAAPRGTFIGIGTGIGIGTLAWLVRGGAVIPDVVLLMLAGGAVGGLVDWIDGAAAAGGRGPALMSTFSVSTR